MKSMETTWKKVLNIIKENTTPISYETWFSPLHIKNIDEELCIAYIAVSRDKGTDMAINIIKEMTSQIK